MSLDFGAHEDVVFENDPLVSVLCQVKFPPIFALTSPVAAAGFQEGLREGYPEFIRDQPAPHVQLGPGSISLNTSAPLWRLRDETQQWTVGISVDFVSLETPRYSSIDEFLDRFEAVLQVLERTLKPSLTKRIGFRKINMFDADDPLAPAAFVGIIRPELLGTLGVKDFPPFIGGQNSVLQFADEDNSLFVRSGLVQFGEDANVRFTIDLDHFTERPYAVDSHELIPLLRDFSESMTSFFHWAIVPEYIPTLSPVQRHKEIDPE